MLLVAVWVGFTRESMSLANATLLPFWLLTFCVWPINCVALNALSTLNDAPPSGRKGSIPPRTARMARLSRASVWVRSRIRRVDMANLLGDESQQRCGGIRRAGPEGPRRN